jgi:hypothetical protein
MLIMTWFLPALADADPLGVNTNVTFDEVGGLDDRTCVSHISFWAVPNIVSRYTFSQGDDSAAAPLPRGFPTL